MVDLGVLFTLRLSNRGNYYRTLILFFSTITWYALYMERFSDYLDWTFHHYSDHTWRSPTRGCVRVRPMLLCGGAAAAAACDDGGAR